MALKSSASSRPKSVGSTLKSKQVAVSPSSKSVAPTTTSRTRTKGKQLRLYDLKQRDGIVLHYADLVMEFSHLDGMYSYNVILEGKSHGKAFHISRSAPLKKIGDKEYEVILH